MFVKTAIIAGIMSSAVSASHSTSAIADLMAAAIEPEVETTSCVCTTVPCPVAGINYLSIPGGGTGSYNYVMHGT